MFYTEKANVFYHVTLVNLVYPAKKKKFSQERNLFLKING